MSAPSPAQFPSRQADTASRAGAWLFRHRTAAALPFAIALLTLRTGEAAPNPWLSAAGLALTAAGELTRLWAVRHIGTISRTRSDRLGPLVESGPFALVRNPLYLGNLALWTGFALTVRLVWLAPVIVMLLGAAYHVIVRWEERLLEARLGDAYSAYARRAPRWIPAVPAHRTQLPAPLFPWRETFYSERGTLIAIATGYFFIWLKLHRRIG